MSRPEDKARAQRTHSLSRRAALLEGGMCVYNALNLGDTLNAILLAEWLRNAAEDRLSPHAAEQQLVDVVNKILGPRR